VIDPDAADVWRSDPSLVFTFFNVLLVIVTALVVAIESGTYVPFNVITTVDPIVVLVRLSVPDATWISVNPAVIAVVSDCCNTDDPNVRLVVDDVIKGVTPFPSVVPNVNLIRVNVNSPPFVIPAPLSPNPLPTLTVARSVPLDFTVVPVSVTLSDSSPPVSMLISLPVVTLKCPVAFWIVLHLYWAVPQ
jgi:hypothetical protein